MMATTSNWIESADSYAQGWHEAIQRHGRISAIRPIRQFAEEDLVIPDGDFAGQLFRAYRQPAHGVWFDEIDSGRWSRFSFVACQQSGKTLAGFVAPTMYHLFETQETVIVGLPTMDIAGDKWNIDIKPAIAASRYSKFLPTSGPGSKGGTPELVQFKNGVSLKFMTGGGGDEKRSAFTSRVLVVTEADKLDQTGAGSDESTKLKQLEGRTRFYGNRKRIYLECTVSEETGSIWQEWLKGSGGVVHQPCHSCGKFVAPEREHFVSWESAEEEIDAEEGRFSCPACGIVWSEETRRQQLQQAVLVHRGQRVGDDGIDGSLPRTRTCGFRYSASANAFADTAMIGVDEWKAKRALDQELADRELLQWTWAYPPPPRTRSVEPLELQQLKRRQSNLRRTKLPADVVNIAVGVDARDDGLEWFAIAERRSGGPLCIDYGFEVVAKHEKDLDIAMKEAAARLRDRFDFGWTIEGDPEETPDSRSADVVLLDCHYNTDPLYEACLLYPTWVPSIGFGYEQHAGSAYSNPRKSSDDAPVVGDEWHLKIRERMFDGLKHKFKVCQMNADVWKLRVHRALSVPEDHPSALLLPFSEDPNGRLKLAQQLMAEKQVRKHVDGKGIVLKWVTVFYKNHWLDAAYMALVGLSILNFETEAEEIEYEPEVYNG